MGREMLKNYTALKLPKIDFGSNFSILSQTVLEISREKKTFRMDGWMDG